MGQGLLDDVPPPARQHQTSAYSCTTHTATPLTLDATCLPPRRSSRTSTLKPRPSLLPPLLFFGVCASPTRSPVGKRALECERDADQLPVIRAEQHDAHGHATARKLDGRGQHDGGRAADSA